jgi:hypothetical protein
MIHHDEDVNKDHDDDRLIEHYDTILKESALLATFAGILFGFLLQISINTPKYFTSFDKAILLVALFSITIAASLFAMPVIYHHLQYPYRNLEKFKVRSHRFTILGLIHSDYIISWNRNCTWLCLNHCYGIWSGCDTIHYCIYIL